MALTITFTKAERKPRTTAPVKVPADVAADLQDTYEALRGQSKSTLAQAVFGTPGEARRFARQARAWADANGKRYVRKGSPKEVPMVVEFRLFDPKP